VEAVVETSTPEHWPSMANVWNEIGPPLRPCAEDIAHYQRFAEPALAKNGSPQILLLGVTPELYRIAWPSRRDFLAVDRTLTMIKHVWPGRGDEVLVGDWEELLLPETSRDLVLCDGGLHLLQYPAAQKRVVARLAQVARAGGRCVFRLFVLPSRRETAAAVLNDLRQGKIPDLNHLKLRLGMALQRTPEEGVAVHEIRETLRATSGDWLSLAARLRWPLSHLRAIDVYRQSNSRYHFLSLDDAIELFCSGGEFRLAEQALPSYPLGERCPLVAFVRT
jgi:SAM-dependent methyltransferase